jgi:hypothetical protein
VIKAATFLPGDAKIKSWHDGMRMKTVKFSSCQDLILASPGGDLADVMRLPMNADAERYQGQALV